MRVRVLFFGVLRESLQCAEQTLELAPMATAASVLDHYRAARPALGELWNTVAVAVNRHYAAGSTPLAEDDEVALLPPVSGGAPDSGTVPQPEPARPTAWLTREPIATASIVEQVKAGVDGAVVIFDGIVRDNTRGRQTLYLDYHGYEEMAVDRMQALAVEAVERFAVRQAVLVHRLGQLEVGQSSVLIVVVSAHRAAAFEACRWLIDTLKTTVPIWKKEYFVDGAVWADGEPFPEAILAPGAGPGVRS